MIAKIAVSAAVFSIDKPYDYNVPQSMTLLPGQRVIVPFGRANKRSEGVVLALEEGYGEKLKFVEQKLDETPLLDDKMLHMAAFLRERYFCTFYDAVKVILPAGVWFQTNEEYQIAEENWREQIVRQPVALSVMQTIEELGGRADESLLRKQFEEDALHKALHYLLAKKLLLSETNRRRRVQDKTERIAILNVTAEEALEYAATKKKTAPLQAATLELLATLGECAEKDLRYYTGATGATFQRLQALGYVDFAQEERLRLRHVVPMKLDGELRLNAQQQAAYEGLRSMNEGVALLYGVTGSGKTSVYIRLIYDCIEKGSSAIVLVPEIALTPQLLSLFAAHFGEDVAVLHSSLRITERYDTWKKIRSGKARVVLGTRSAIFAPVKKLGLIVVDEEQEHTYKSENAPRYHARELAIYRGVQEQAPVVLGSATPSVETMYRAKSGVYRLFTMKNRYNQRPLPPVEIVDMKRELQSGNASAISEPLLLALRENRAQNQQAILFLNRRGTSRMLACVNCGYVPTCPGCTVNLTYHHANGRLMCHYCGYSVRVSARCGECGGQFKQIGFGTQKVQEQLEERLSETQVLRMDADTVSATNPHERLLSRFRDENIPILLGTQMVAKGLNFENVTLVGVLDADMSLYVGSYRAAENTFSMITQVIGRAGRGAVGGRALIQTMTPENQVITMAAKQDYDGFYDMELPLRRLRACPPFRDLITLTFHGRDEARVWQAAQKFRALLASQLQSEFYKDESVQLLGPAPAQVARVNFVYRCKLTLSCKNTRNLRRLLAYWMREFLKDKTNRDVGVFADVNSNE